MKGFGTDEKALVRVLAGLDPLQVSTLRMTYHQTHNRDLLKDIKSETTGYFEEALCAIVHGPLEQDVLLLKQATDGLGTKEKVINDVLLGRSNADLRIIKSAYQQTWGASLESQIKSDLSMKTERHFMMVLAANRTEDSVAISPQHTEQDVLEIYKATEGRMGTAEELVCSIMSQRSNAQLAAIAVAYKQKFAVDLEQIIKKVRQSQSYCVCSVEDMTSRTHQPSLMHEVSLPMRLSHSLPGKGKDHDLKF